MDETDIIRRVIKVGTEIKGILEGVGRDLNSDAPVGGWKDATDKVTTNEEIDQAYERGHIAGYEKGLQDPGSEWMKNRTQVLNETYETGKFDGYAQRAHEERQKRQMEDPLVVLEKHSVAVFNAQEWSCRCGKRSLQEELEFRKHQADELIKAGYGLPPLEKGQEQALTQGKQAVTTLLDKIKNGRYNFSAEHVSADLSYLLECFKAALPPEEKP